MSDFSLKNEAGMAQNAMPMDMVTLNVVLHTAGHELTLAVPEVEWKELLNNFKRMQVDERQRVGVSIRNAVAQNPFPLEPRAMMPSEQERCDAFVSDCILVAALAEVAGKRVLEDTAVGSYTVTRGNLVKPRFN